jgi:transposase InsO family protein
MTNALRCLLKWFINPRNATNDSTERFVMSGYPSMTGLVIEEVQDFATQWMCSYNHDRPHMAFGGFTPKQHLAKAA